MPHQREILVSQVRHLNQMEGVILEFLALMQERAGQNILSRQRNRLDLNCIFVHIFHIRYEILDALFRYSYHRMSLVNFLPDI